MSESATELLRKLLDERGVKWWPMRNNGYYEDRDTEFVVNGKKHTAHEWGDGLAVYNLTPEQAIAATLGSEREKQLELLVNQLWYLVNHRSGYGYAAALEAIEELGIEVDE